MFCCARFASDSTRTSITLRRLTPSSGTTPPPAEARRGRPPGAPPPRGHAGGGGGGAHRGARPHEGHRREERGPEPPRHVGRVLERVKDAHRSSSPGRT